MKEHGFRKAVTTTTRPPRAGEVHGKDYYFVSEALFETIENKKGFIETILFNGYHYGISVSELISTETHDNPMAVILDPNGVISLSKYLDLLGKQAINIYIDGEYEILLARYLQRLVGVDLNNPKIADDHAKRISSLAKEVTRWKPHGTRMKLNWDVAPEWCIPYDLILDKFSSSIEVDAITKIKNLINKENDNG